RQIKRQNRESQQRLEAERQRLDTALNNMTQGLVLYDAAGRLVICNRRYREMYHLTEDDTRSGCSFHDVLRFRRDRGAFTGNIDEIHARVMQ
ncbi:PAS-domain containing protein, partial [Klebsiella pneumoniae]|uniref:PAS-domain containing protein n=1 Tax=Klebsiella pneumoniae TaxID=573 RepID=UPI003D027A6F